MNGLALANGTRTVLSTDEAFAWCIRYARSRVAGDPLAVALEVPGLRRELSSLYAFARVAADLGQIPASAADRLEALARWEAQLVSAYHGQARHPVFVALAAVARSHDLPINALTDLLHGVRSEINPREPATFSSYELSCSLTAGPIARALLILAGERRPAMLLCGERLGIGLRLLDDLADLRRDVARGRFRLPAEDRLAFGVELDDLRADPWPPVVDDLLAFETARARTFLAHGRALMRSSTPIVQALVGGLLSRIS